MKILAIGDFHGEFPSWINKVIKKEKIDLVVSNGDYLPFHYRKLWFKHCYASGVQLWEVIGKKKYKELVRKDLEMGEKAIKKLNTLPVPVITVLGNVDHVRVNDSFDYTRYQKKYGKWDKWKWDEKDFINPILKKYKNIKRFDYKTTKFEDYIFIGAYGGTNRGMVQSKAFRKHRKILDNLFKKYKKENKSGKVIFVSHNVPYNTKLDKAGPHAHERVRGKHIGSKLIRRVINTHQPILHIGGHMHEAMGEQKIGKTLAVNPGAAHDGKAAIITLPENKKGKIKVKFIK